MDLKKKRVFYNKIQMNNNICYECIYYLCPTLIDHICKNNDNDIDIDEYETDMLLQKKNIVIINQPEEHKIEIDFENKSNQLTIDNLKKLNTNNCKITLDSDNSNLYNNDIKKMEVFISDNSNIYNNDIKKMEVSISDNSNFYNSDTETNTETNTEINTETNTEKEIILISDSDISNLSDCNSNSSKFDFSSDSEDPDFCILIEK